MAIYFESLQGITHETSDQDDGVFLECGLARGLYDYAEPSEGNLTYKPSHQSFHGRRIQALWNAL
jgi:hypothetical protein